MDDEHLEFIPGEDPHHFLGCDFVNLALLDYEQLRRQQQQQRRQRPPGQGRRGHHLGAPGGQVRHPRVVSVSISEPLTVLISRVKSQPDEDEAR